MDSDRLQLSNYKQLDECYILLLERIRQMEGDL